MKPSITENDWRAPIIYLVYITLVDILPIVGQLISMAVILDTTKFRANSVTIKKESLIK